MYWFFDKSQECEAINISAGEYFVSAKGVLVHTILGSTLSVVLYDSNLKIGGMNHFLFPLAKNGSISNGIEHKDDHAIAVLLNEFIKRGSDKSQLKAKILGGSIFSEEDKNIVSGNIRFIEKYLNSENIEIISRDTGGDKARKIYLHSATFKVFLKRLNFADTDLEKQMAEYLTRLKN